MKEGIIKRDKCPVCNSTSSKSIFNRSFNEDILKEYIVINYYGNADLGFLEDIIFEIVKCNKCNFSYQKYILDEERLTELYDKWIDPVLAQKWHEDEKLGNLHTYAYILNFAKKYLKRESDEIKVLDYGAGFGDSLILAKEMRFDAYAYEYSSERIRYLEQKGIKVVDDKNRMLFDLIIVNSVLEHLTYPDETLKVIISKLNKNGILYLGVPNCSHIERNLEKANIITDATKLKQSLIETSVNAFQHINFFTSYSLRQLFKKNGIKPVNPFKQTLMKPLSIKSFIRPFYHVFYKDYLNTRFFLEKIEK